MDLFNRDERRPQTRFSRIRDRFFAPVVELLYQANVRPNFVTIAGIAFLVAGCVVGPGTGLQGPALWLPSLLIFCYCVLDGIDGPLARKSGRAHEGGAIVDIAADQLGVILVPAAAIFHLDSQPVVAILFSNAYIAFINFVAYCNTHGIRLPRFLRFKYPLYIGYCLSVGLDADIIGYLMIALLPYYAIMSLVALRAIYAFHDRPR